MLIPQIPIYAFNNLSLGGAKIDMVVSDDDTAGATRYYGYLSVCGKWMIMRITAGTYRFCVGVSGYTTAWDGRAALTYTYFNLLGA